jgi:hypothetical protein
MAVESAGRIVATHYQQLCANMKAALEGPFCTQTKLTWSAKTQRSRSRAQLSIP